MKLLLTNESISNGAVALGQAILVDEGVIKRIGPAEEIMETPEAKAAEVVDLRRLTVTPGFIDTHVHGGNGFDTMDGQYASINEMSVYKLKEGVTAFLPTTVTASDAKTAAAVESVNTALEKGVDGAKVLGIFLEGPYINAKNKGAHPEEFIRPISLPEMEALVGSCKGGVISIAVAPELPGAKEAIVQLAKKNITIRAGHSSATLVEAYEAFDNGAGSAIHTYNAMSPLNHREPGMVGAVMTHANVYGEIICDLVHVHPKAVQLLVQAKGADKVILITDCMQAGGLPDGEYALGELPVRVKDGVARLFDGALAGSTTTIATCVKNMHETVGVPLVDTIQMATANPAKSIGVFDRIGSLDEGKCADIIALDEHLNVCFVMVDGEIKRANA